MTKTQRTRRVNEGGARARAIRWNNSGTYAAASRATGASAASLSQWARELHAPRDEGMALLRLSS